jgi:hypothetical protein
VEAFPGINKQDCRYFTRSLCPVASVIQLKPGYLNHTSASSNKTRPKSVTPPESPPDSPLSSSSAHKVILVEDLTVPFVLATFVLPDVT